jgi:hypothetical protein
LCGRSVRVARRISIPVAGPPRRAGSSPVARSNFLIDFIHFYIVARSKTSASGLSVIVTPLGRFVRSWQGGEHGDRHSPPSATTHANTLPPLILLSSQRGEGILRAQFFGSKSGQLGDKLPHQPSPEQWLDYWHRFVEKRGHIVDLVQRIGLIEAVSQETALAGKAATSTNAADEALCFTLYTALLEQLQERGETDLLNTATTKFFVLLWKQQFPQFAQQVLKQAADPAKIGVKASSNIQALKDKALIRVRKTRHPQAILKESWREVAGVEVGEKSKIEFAVRMQAGRGGAWSELVSLSRPRLKTARLAAWQSLLLSEV